MTEALPRKIDICSKIILRMLDEDDTVKVSKSLQSNLKTSEFLFYLQELAIKTIEELWFSPQTSVKQVDTNPANLKRQQTATVSVIIGVCGYFKDRQSPLDDLLNKILSSKDGSENSLLQNRFSELVDALIDGLIDGATAINSVCLI